ncbi:tyrosine-type recombinase/integrase [Sulfurimonas sp. HSL-1656]|uniref:tyrosine-type recombinase/integrase n=1 Tax=Thiomicrolovo subterrani TaxID=3131934 RepID=UPI0031F9BACC
MKLITRNGKLWITFYHQSKRYRRSLGLDDNKANRALATNKILPEIIYKLNSGMFFDKETTIPTVSEYALTSFALHEHHRKASTKYDYTTSLRLHIAPRLGKKRLDRIKPSDIALWQNELLQTLTPRRVRNVRAVLNTFFEDAIRDEIIDKNPVSKVKLPKIEKVDVTPFTMDETKRIIENAEGDLQTFCALGFFTGMRSGEMIGLRWEDVDFERGEISIKRAIKMGVVSTPKTQSSIRTIDILDPLMPYLKAQYERTGEEGAYVFLNKNGEHYYDIKRIRDTRWKKLLKKLGIEYRTIYQMRHTFATVMIENGEDILWVSHMLGHTDTSMTLQMYAKYRKQKDKKRAAFLADVL